MSEHTVASADELDHGEGKVIEVDGLSVALFNVKNEYYAISNRCTHKGGPLAEGFFNHDLPTFDEEKLSVHCPWHFWEFDLETGKNPVNPKASLRAFDVSVSEDDEVVISL